MTSSSSRTLLSLLIAALATTAVHGLAFLTKEAPTATSSSVYTGLQSTPLVRASDQQSVLVTDLWRSQTPLGLADETAVCAFLRHFGWFICWEAAAALRDQVLPAVPKLYFVGVGTGEAAAEFAEQLGVDPALCLADDGGIMGDTLGLQQGFGTMWNPQAVNNMMERNDENSLKALGEAYKGAADNIGIQQLAPKKITDTLRQGGTFVFKGDQLVLEHYDQKVGDHASIDDILKAASM